MWVQLSQLLSSWRRALRCLCDVFQVCTETREEPRSAFSPLGLINRGRRFLTAPYSGTGYLPTVIRPPPELLHHPLYPPAPSPGSATGSDRTSYSEWLPMYSNSPLIWIFVEILSSISVTHLVLYQTLPIWL